MSEMTQAAQARVIVIPRRLEGFFYGRLTQYYSGRSDVRVIIDRRDGDRRQDRWLSGPGPFAERRRGERRDASVAWKLTDMPVSTS